MFEKVNSKVVKVNLAQSGDVLARKGAMLFYSGNVSFVPANAGGMARRRRDARRWAASPGWPAARWRARTS